MAEDWNALARSLNYADEKDMLEDFYMREGMTVSRIAKVLGAGQATIVRRLNLCKIQKRPKGGANNTAKLTWKFHRMDQRLIFSLPLALLAKMTGAASNTLYKYRRGVTGYGVLCDIADSRIAEVCNTEQDASAAGTDPVERVLGLLQEEERSRGLSDPGQRSVRGSGSEGDRVQDEGTLPRAKAASSGAS